MGLREKFDAANATLDGRLTKQQAEAANMPQVAANFEAIDMAGAGYVSFDQVKAFKDAKAAKIRKVRQTKAKVGQRKAMAQTGAPA